MDAEPSICNVDVVLFDFGGVLADEGFANGLKAIARRHGLDETEFINLARDLIHRTGYITGRGREPAYWQAIRSATGITGDDATLRNEILSRFTPRAWMLNIVRKLRTAGVRVVILSDQTNWLDELNDLHRFFKHFNIVYNSYHIGKSKADPTHFSDTVSNLRAAPDRMLFIDDDEGHCERARLAGINAIRFTGREQFLEELSRYCPGDWTE
jgi:putative hydrolase of the HAD superfamily